jgi:hypothetical protein
MSGMKEGAGENPFEEDTEPEAADVELVESESEKEAEKEPAGGNLRNKAQIPYKYRRSSVHEERERVALYLQEQTAAEEETALEQLEEQVGESIPKADLREALVRAGIQNLADAEEELEEWGYGLDFN